MYENKKEAINKWLFLHVSAFTDAMQEIWSKIWFETSYAKKISMFVINLMACCFIYIKSGIAKVMLILETKQFTCNYFSIFVFQVT